VKLYKLVKKFTNTNYSKLIGHFREKVENFSKTQENWKQLFSVHFWLNKVDIFEIYVKFCVFWYPWSPYCEEKKCCTSVIGSEKNHWRWLYDTLIINCVAYVYCKRAFLPCFCFKKHFCRNTAGCKVHTVPGTVFTTPLWKGMVSKMKIWTETVTRDGILKQ
jgi:hypothetical protein